MFVAILIWSAHQISCLATWLTNSWTIGWWHLLQALCRAVSPLLSCWMGLAPLARRCLRTAMVPDSADMCRGVLPSDMARLVSAPDLSNILVHFSPRDSSIREAMCNGVSPIDPPVRSWCAWLQLLHYCVNLSFLLRVIYLWCELVPRDRGVPPQLQICQPRLPNARLYSCPEFWECQIDRMIISPFVSPQQHCFLIDFSYICCSVDIFSLGQECVDNWHVTLHGCRVNASCAIL